MDKIVRNDIRVNLTSVEKIMVFKIDYNARTMHVFLPTCKLLIYNGANYWWFTCISGIYVPKSVQKNLKNHCEIESGKINSSV